MANNAKLFFGALPTDLELRKLKARWPSPVPGDVLTYAEISAVIGLDPNKGRFRTVLNRWRREISVEISFPRDGTVRFLTPPEHVTAVQRDFVSLGRKARRVANRAARIDVERLDEPTRAVAEMLQGAARSLFDKAAEEAKALRLALKPPAQLPR